MKELETEEEYLNALKRLEEIFNSKVGTPESDEADKLADLIVKYEDKKYPFI